MSGVGLQDTDVGALEAGERWLRVGEHGAYWHDPAHGWTTVTLGDEGITAIGAVEGERVHQASREPTATAQAIPASVREALTAAGRRYGEFTSQYEAGRIIVPIASGHGAVRGFVRRAGRSLAVTLQEGLVVQVRIAGIVDGNVARAIWQLALDPLGASIELDDRIRLGLSRLDPVLVADPVGVAESLAQGDLRIIGRDETTYASWVLEGGDHDAQAIGQRFHSGLVTRIELG